MITDTRRLHEIPVMEFWRMSREERDERIAAERQSTVEPVAAVAQWESTPSVTESAQVRPLPAAPLHLVDITPNIPTMYRSSRGGGSALYERHRAAIRALRVAVPETEPTRPRPQIPPPSEWPLDPECVTAVEVRWVSGRWRLEYSA